MSDVVFATDFSECSETAARVARDWAQRLGARLHVLHVVWPASDPTPQSSLAKAAEGLGNGVVVVTAVESGLPAARIVDYAARQGAQLIVLGTHGRTGVSRALIGSVAERVVRMAPCPVLTVPSGWHGMPGRPERPELPPQHCLVCARSSHDLICEPCRARIRGEAIERKQQEGRAGRA